MATRVKLNRQPRVHLKFVPQFQGAVHGHAVNMIRRFYPALQRHHTFEDLLQEAWVVFLKCQRKYGGDVTNAAWFMSLYSTSLNHKLIRLVEFTKRYNCVDAEGIEPVSDTENMGFLSVMLQELPQDIKELLRAMCLPTTDHHRLRKLNRKLIKRILNNGLDNASLLRSRKSIAV